MPALRTVARSGCLGFLAIFVLGEAGVRLWERSHEPTGSLYDYVVPAGSRFKLRPGASVVVPERYGDIHYRFNRAGYRDRDHSPGPADGRRRIVLLGDSVTFGLGVNQERTFAALLQERLDARLGPAWRVANLAMFAYHTENELAAFREDGLAHRPALVVLQFYMNDFAIPEKAPETGEPVKPGWTDRLVAAKNQLVYKSAFYRRLHQAGAGLAYHLFHDVRRRRFPQTLNAAEPVDKTRYLRERPDDAAVPAFRALGAIDDLARRHGARLAVLLTPDEVELFDRRYGEVNRRVRRFCAGRGIPLVDPLPVLRRQADPANLFNDGVHLSPAGHAVVAEVLFSELVGQGMVRR